MDMNEQSAILEKIKTAVGDMEEFFTKGPSSEVIAMEAKNDAEGLLKNFEKELGRREEENLVLRRENQELGKLRGDVAALEKTLHSLNEELERARHDGEKALKERDKAKEEVARLQELWRRFTEGE
jgi:DNA repair exonuclease SbcCD ATPase subunit